MLLHVFQIFLFCFMFMSLCCICNINVNKLRVLSTFQNPRYFNKTQFITSKSSSFLQSKAMQYIRLRKSKYGFCRYMLQKKVERNVRMSIKKYLQWMDPCYPPKPVRRWRQHLLGLLLFPLSHLFKRKTPCRFPCFDLQNFWQDSLRPQGVV